jgi:hypothetical protein
VSASNIHDIRDIRDDDDDDGGGGSGKHLFARALALLEEKRKRKKRKKKRGQKSHSRLPSPTFNVISSFRIPWSPGGAPPLFSGASGFLSPG